MPGTILVSVLEFMGLPLSSSSTSITVSLGKREYQTGNNGEFSFPLTSLRDNLIVKLQDADGNEISAGVETKSIVEKGIWEDFFPLGDGQVLLRFEFVLNAEERDRVRMMRASALKKKHDELLNSSPKSVESSITSVGNSASPFRKNHEVSESRRKDLQLEAISVKEVASQDSLVSIPVGFSNDEKPSTENIEVAQPDQKALNPNYADDFETSSTKPVSQAGYRTKLHHKGLNKEMEIQSPAAKDPEGAVGSEETPILSTSIEQNANAIYNLIPPNQEKGSARYPQKKRRPSGKMPSSVRKMISAFESSVTQDSRSHTKSLPAKHESSETETAVPSKTQHLKEAKAKNMKPSGMTSGSVKNASLSGDLQHGATYISKDQKQINILTHKSSENTIPSKDLSTMRIQKKQTDSNVKSNSKVAGNDETHTLEDKTNKDIVRTSTIETATVSGMMPAEHSYRHQPCSIPCTKQDSRSNPSIEEKRRETALNDSQEIHTRRDSPHKEDSMVDREDKYPSSEGSGAWILPDGTRRLCITTAGRKVMDILGGQIIKPTRHQKRMDFSISGNVEKNPAHDRTDTGVNKHERIYQIKIPEPKNPGEDENPGGPLKQAVRIAIMVGFGILVVLTRQRKNR
ncbi:WD repeat containing protein [Quillaja saponaria]|uniref:WD repeat containing protein n=1 Tax=Quillaja saponaria TaxID=32244 RepID=A0AAD7LD83_QUISA|nr:WD repeat containing protein [Quillaja saponaria]